MLYQNKPQKFYTPAALPYYHFPITHPPLPHLIPIPIPKPPPSQPSLTHITHIIQLSPHNLKARRRLQNRRLNLLPGIQVQILTDRRTDPLDLIHFALDRPLMVVFAQFPILVVEFDRTREVGPAEVVNI